LIDKSSVVALPTASVITDLTIPMSFAYQAVALSANVGFIGTLTSFTLTERIAKNDFCLNFEGLKSSGGDIVPRGDYN